MAYRTIRPSSAPYNLTGTGLATFSATFGVVDPIPTADLGSLADDSDATFTSFSSNSDGVSYDATVVAFDFAPISGVNPDSSYGAFARLSRPWTPNAGAGESYQNNAIALYDGDTWSELDDFDFNSIVHGSGTALNFVAATPTTYTSANDDFFSSGGSLAGGFTVAIAVRANVVAPTEVLRLYEFGLFVDVRASGPIRRKYPNATGQGVGPTRHWPPVRRGVTGIN